MQDPPPFRPEGLGEIAIRCRDMDAMVAFYEERLFLRRIVRGPDNPITFFRIAEGVAGHTTVLALFPPEPGPLPTTGAPSSLHHLALSLPWAAQEAAIAHFDEIGNPYRIEVFGWVGWRGLFLTDPDGNTVELVAFNPALKDDQAAD